VAPIIHFTGIPDQWAVSKALWTASERGSHDARLKTMTDDHPAPRFYRNKYDRHRDTLGESFDAFFHSAAHSGRWCFRRRPAQSHASTGNGSSKWWRCVLCIYIRDERRIGERSCVGVECIGCACRWIESHSAYANDKGLG